MDQLDLVLNLMRASNLAKTISGWAGATSDALSLAVGLRSDDQVATTNALSALGVDAAGALLEDPLAETTFSALKALDSELEWAAEEKGILTAPQIEGTKYLANQAAWDSTIGAPTAVATQVGNAVGEFVSSGTAQQTASAGTNAAIQTLSAFIPLIEAEHLGNGVGNFVSSGTAQQTVSAASGAAFQTLSPFIPLIDAEESVLSSGSGALSLPGSPANPSPSTSAFADSSLQNWMMMQQMLASMNQPKPQPVVQQPASGLPTSQAQSALPATQSTTTTGVNLLQGKAPQGAQTTATSTTTKGTGARRALRRQQQQRPLHQRERARQARRRPRALRLGTELALPGRPLLAAAFVPTLPQLQASWVPPRVTALLQRPVLVARAVLLAPMHRVPTYPC